jgi:hypothetical protein
MPLLSLSRPESAAAATPWLWCPSPPLLLQPPSHPLPRIQPRLVWNCEGDQGKEQNSEVRGGSGAGGGLVASKWEAAARAPAASGQHPGERWHKLVLDSKSETSRHLLWTSQIVDRQLELVVSLQVVDIEVATGWQVAQQISVCRTTRNPWDYTPSAPNDQMTWGITHMDK